MRPLTPGPVVTPFPEVVVGHKVAEMQGVRRHPAAVPSRFGGWC